MDRQPGNGSNRNETRGHHPEIIVAGKGERFAPGTLDYALGVAQRLGADILAVSVNTLPEYDEGFESQRALRFASSSVASTLELRLQAQEKGVAFRHLCRKGKVSQVLSSLFREHRHVSFVLVEEDIPLAEVSQHLSVPVFTVNGAAKGRLTPGQKTTVPELRTLGTFTRNNKTKGAHVMADTSKKQARSKAALFGVLSAAIYAAVFSNSGQVMEYFTKGGFYNILPVLTVITVSYVHGSFASNVWTALGINASHKSVSSSKKEAPARQTPRPRARMQA